MTVPEPAWWVRVTIPDDVNLVEPAAAELWSIGTTAVWHDGSDLVAGFPDADGADAAAAILSERWPVRTGADDRPWSQAWRAFVQPVEVGRIRIVTPGAPAEPRGRATPALERGAAATAGAVPPRPELVIEPGESFGSGHHVTTRQCLRAVDELVGPGRSILDVGSGSGVLSVAAAALGAYPVVAVDIDPCAAALTAANAGHNEVEVLVICGTLDAVRGRYDLVIANLGGALAPTALAADLTRVTAPGGVLVIAGLLETQGDAVAAALGAGFRDQGRESQEGWSALRMSRRVPVEDQPHLGPAFREPA